MRPQNSRRQVPAHRPRQCRARLPQTDQPRSLRCLLQSHRRNTPQPARHLLQLLHPPPPQRSRLNPAPHQRLVMLPPLHQNQVRFLPNRHHHNLARNRVASLWLPARRLRYMFPLRKSGPLLPKVPSAVSPIVAAKVMKKVRPSLPRCTLL